MTWGKVDDKLWGHPKWMAATGPARGLWITALSWCMSQETDGFVPRHALVFLGGTTRHASSLVTCGLWDAAEGGYQFHDWADYQPDAASLRAKRDKESTAGREGNHRRWHVARRISVPDCEYCVSGEVSGTRSGSRGSTRIGGESSRTRTQKEGGKDGSSGGSSVVREDEPPMLETSIPKHKLPAGWGPSSAHYAQAVNDGLNLDREVTKFRSHARSKGYVSLDWDAEFTRWLVGSAERHDERTAGQVPAGTDRQALILRGEMERAVAHDAAAKNVINFPQIGGTA